MKPIFLLFYLINGILANNPCPPRSDYINDGNNYRHGPDTTNYNQPNYETRPVANQALVNSNSGFAFKIFKQACSNGGGRSKPDKKNVVLSPLCISSAFAMVALGAKANTLDQILQGLNFKPAELPERNIHEGFHDLIYLLNNGNSGLQVEMGSCLFVQNKLHPQPEYLRGVRNIYQGDFYMEDFTNSLEAEQHINSYIERKTHGKISKLVDGVDPITEILLVSYIYMTAKWKYPFDPKNTEIQKFYVDPSTVVQVPMMFQIGNFETSYDNELACTILRLPYEGNAAAYFILPDKGQMERVVSGMSCDVLRKWKKILSKSLVNVYLPKCVVNGQLDLKEIMYPMGIVDVFTDKADLSGITGQPQHMLSSAIHKAVIIMDERGTEGAAASSMGIVPLSMPLVIQFNQPFLFLVSDEETSSIVFTSKIINPVE